MHICLTLSGTSARDWCWKPACVTLALILISEAHFHNLQLKFAQVCKVIHFTAECITTACPNITTDTNNNQVTNTMIYSIHTHVSEYTAIYVTNHRMEFTFFSPEDQTPLTTN